MKKILILLSTMFLFACSNVEKNLILTDDSFVFNIDEILLEEYPSENVNLTVKNNTGEKIKVFVESKLYVRIAGEKKELFRKASNKIDPNIGIEIDTSSRRKNNFDLGLTLSKESYLTQIGTSKDYSILHFGKNEEKILVINFVLKDLYYLDGKEKIELGSEGVEVEGNLNFYTYKLNLPIKSIPIKISL